MGPSLVTDPDGYPTEEERARIREWPFAGPDTDDGWEQVRQWFAYVSERWYRSEIQGHRAPWAWGEEPSVLILGGPPHWEWAEGVIGDTMYGYRLSTGGWRVNVKLVSAMRANRALWEATLWAGWPGGHYEFRVRRPLRSA